MSTCRGCDPYCSRETLCVGHRDWCGFCIAVANHAGCWCAAGWGRAIVGCNLFGPKSWVLQRLRHPVLGFHSLGKKILQTIQDEAKFIWLGCYLKYMIHTNPIYLQNYTSWMSVQYLDVQRTKSLWAALSTLKEPYCPFWALWQVRPNKTGKQNIKTIIFINFTIEAFWIAGHIFG